MAFLYYLFLFFFPSGLRSQVSGLVSPSGLPSSDYLRGNSDGNATRRYILGHHGSGSDDAAVSDGDTGGDNDAGTEPDIIADADVTLALGLLPEVAPGANW